jgi:hypothetical protein
MRGDFDRALLSGNAEGARQYLQEMLRSGRVTAEQARYLEIRFLAGLGNLEELARNHPLISSVMELPLPPQTLADVVHALYSIHISPLEPVGDVGAISTAFRDNIGRHYGPLFRERKGVSAPDVLRAFLLYELNAEQPDISRCEALLEAYPESSPGRDLAETFLRHLRPERVSHDALAQAKQAIADEDYESALALATEALPDPWAYRALLRCATELQSDEVTRRVLETLAVANADVVGSFGAKDKQRLERLKDEARRPSRVIDNWVDWATSVNEDPDSIPIAPLLEKAVVTWTDEEFLHDGKRPAELARQIGNAKGRSEEVFREAFPFLVQFFVDRPENPVRMYGPIYLALIRLVALSDGASPDELRLASSIAEAFLTVGPAKQVYEECVEALLELLEGNKAVINVDWALDTSELLACYPSPSPEFRLRFFMQTADLVAAMGHRMSGGQRNLLALLAQDYSSPGLLERLPPVKSEEREIGKEFSGLVGLYSLSENSAKRASEVLRTLLPGARIEINSDTTATDRLKKLAKRADIFVFAWKKSTHPAFYCVKDARVGQELLLSPGGGAASLVRSVVDSLQPLS